MESLEVWQCTVMTLNGHLAGIYHLDSSKVLPRESEPGNNLAVTPGLRCFSQTTSGHPLGRSRFMCFILPAPVSEVVQGHRSYHVCLPNVTSLQAACRLSSILRRNRVSPSRSCGVVAWQGSLKQDQDLA